MGARNGWNLMPENGSRLRRILRSWLVYPEIFDALGVEMNLAAVIAGEPLE